MNLDTAFEQMLGDLKTLNRARQFMDKASEGVAAQGVFEGWNHIRKAAGMVFAVKGTVFDDIVEAYETHAQSCLQRDEPKARQILAKDAVTFGRDVDFKTRIKAIGRTQKPREATPANVVPIKPPRPNARLKKIVTKSQIQSKPMAAKQAKNPFAANLIGKRGASGAMRLSQIP